MQIKEINEGRIKDIKFFAKGHRGILYRGTYKNREIVIKAKLPQSKAVGRIRNEIKWLKILNKYGIGPKLFLSGEDYFVYEFIDGPFILDFFDKANRDEIMMVIKDVLSQCYTLDKLSINKEEMHHPVKHIIIDRNNNNRAVLVDFERCYKTKKPHNVTQFCEFLIRIRNVLIEKGISINKEEIINLAKDYKKKISKANLRKILALLK